MTHLIDKSALVAEIERRKQDAINNCGGFKSIREHECDSCIVGQYEEMEEILNTLEVKDMKEIDLEEALSNLDKDIKEFVTTEEFERDSAVYGHYWAIAKHSFELGLKAQKGE